MRYFFLALMLFTIPDAYAEPPTRYKMTCMDSSQCGEPERKAVRLVNEKYGARIVERLKNSPIYKYPWYWVQLEKNECTFRVKQVEDMPRHVVTWYWFDVDICKGEAKAFHLGAPMYGPGEDNYIEDDDF